MIVTYQAKGYAPELVTGHYARCIGRKRGGYRFIVLEAATGTGLFAGKPGQGPTLREYETLGEELPEELKARCIASKQTEKWK
jgi:hypothetical protein